MKKDDLRVIADDSGCYQVVNGGGEIVASGFTSNADAWRWIDRNTQAGREDRDRHYRIRQSGSFS